MDVFNPIYSAILLQGVDASTNEALPTNGPILKIDNTGPNTAFVRLGNSSVAATTSDCPILINKTLYIARSPDISTNQYMAIICNALGTADASLITGYSNMHSLGFSPVAGATATLSATTTSSSASIGSLGDKIRVVNAGSAHVFVQVGTTGVVATYSSLCILSGEEIVISRGASGEDRIAAITGSGTATVYATPGYGG